MIAGEQRYVWRAVDHEGEVLDVLVQRKRDKSAMSNVTCFPARCCVASEPRRWRRGTQQPRLHEALRPPPLLCTNIRFP